MHVTAANSSEDLPYRHYTLRHRITAWISQNLSDTITYTVRGGLLKGMKRRGGLGWIPRRMTAEDQFWDGLNLSGLTIYDVGAFHGLLTLFFASRAKTVICFEPNTQNHERLIENLKLNKVENVEVRKVGVSSCQETRRMVASPVMLGGATVDDTVARGIFQSGFEPRVQEISMVTLDCEIPERSLPMPDLIKIDIEGWELEALRGASNTLQTHKPALFLEMHGETLREKKRKVVEIVAFIWAMNYRNILHIETGTVITPENSCVAMEGHLYCRPT